MKSGLIRLSSTTRLRLLVELAPGTLFIDQDGSLAIVVSWSVERNPDEKHLAYVRLTGDESFNVIWKELRYQRSYPVAVLPRTATEIEVEGLRSSRVSNAPKGTLVVTANGTNVVVQSAEDVFLVDLQVGVLSYYEHEQHMLSSDWIAYFFNEDRRLMKLINKRTSPLIGDIRSGD